VARVSVFTGGNVAPAQTTEARFRAADFGVSPIAEGLKAAGKALSETAARADEIADVNARVEANQLALEHTETAEQIKTRVKETLGDGADAAAQQGAADLDKATSEILGRASPRARLLLQHELRARDLSYRDSFEEHGFGEKVKAFEATSIARIDKTVQAASDEDDEEKAVAALAPIRQINEERARFFGWSKDAQDTEDRKIISNFYKSRALKKGIGEQGSAQAAIEYATAHRQYMNDDDYTAIVTAYNDSALDEVATDLIDGKGMISSTTTDTLTESGVERHLDPGEFFKSFIAPHEGSAYVVDSNGAGVKYGINEQYNPGVNVKGLTLDGAAGVFTKGSWERSGAASLSPALAAVHADTFFLNERQAKKILKESGGDVDKYIDLRRAFLNGLATSNPGKYGKYQAGWEKRTKDLEAFANRQGPATSNGLAIGPDTNLEDFRKAVMERPDIGLALKRKLISRAEAKRSDARQEQQIAESQAAGKLSLAAANLGDSFTSVNQLPQDAWLVASDSTRAQLTAAAKSNKEQKPWSLDLERDVSFLKTFKPQAFLDPAVQTKLAARGVTQKQMADLVALGGGAAGTAAGAKPDPADRGALESLARPAYQAAGFDFWSTETEKKTPAGKVKAAAEERDEAARRIALVNFLDNEAHAWAINNPGKKADSTTMQGWIAKSLIRVGQQGSARPFGSLNDQEVMNAYGQKNVDTAKQRLQSVGIPPTAANISNYLRRLFARSHGLP